MTIVYLGEKSHVKIGNKFQVEKGIPTYIPWEYSSELETVGGFKIVDEVNPSHRTCEVGVLMPDRVDQFVAALRVLERVREGFPTATILVSAQPDYGFLLPPWVTLVPYPKALPGVPYRVYNLRQSKQLKNMIDNPYTSYSMSMEMIMLHCTGFYNTQTDRRLQPRWLKLFKAGRQAAHFIIPQAPLTAELQVILDALRVAFPNAKEYTPLQLGPTSINTLNNSLLNVFFAETPYHYVSAALHVPTVGIFARPYRYTDSFTRRYENAKYVYKYEMPSYVDKDGQTRFYSKKFTDSWAALERDELARKVTNYCVSLAGVEPARKIPDPQVTPPRALSPWEKLKEQGNVTTSKVSQTRA